jgi:hypothetical protein
MDAPNPQRYDVRSVLGEGGMGIVYRAFDRQLHRDVAIKCLHRFLSQKPDARQRFHREAMIVAKLNHPNIVEIFDYSGPDREEIYLVTELVEGENLKDFVGHHGSIPYPELAVALVLHLAEALCHAHEKGIIHRDLKPENIMIATSGTPMLLDFGIARLAGEANTLTVTGTLIGSPAHMSPEVLNGKPIDERADVFSLGTLLYWLCTDQLPFTGDNPSALFQNILKGTYRDPRDLQPRVSNRLRSILARAMAVDPDERYPTMSAFRAALEEELDGLGIPDACQVLLTYFQDPKAQRSDIGAILLNALLESGRGHLAVGNVAGAADRCHRVLALQADHPEAARMLRSIGRRERWRRLAAGIAVVAALILLAILLRARVEQHPPVLAQPDPSESARPRLAPSPYSTVRFTPRTPATSLAPEPTTGTPSPKEGPPATLRSAPRLNQGESPLAPTPVPTVPRARAFVRVVVGGGFAHIVVDGRVRLSNAFGGRFELEPGRHTIEVVKPDLGRHKPRTIEVDPTGQVFEWVGQERKPVIGELRFRVPRSRDEMGSIEGWISA